jgi:hypothetical protein
VEGISKGVRITTKFKKMNIQPVCVYAQADIEHGISNDEGKTAAKP